MSSSSTEEGDIVGVVVYADEQKCCISCKAKVHPITDVVGECTKCSMKVKLSRCETTASARVKFEIQGNTKEITLFGEAIRTITNGISGEDLDYKLLNTPKLLLYINSSGIATLPSKQD